MAPRSPNRGNARPVVTREVERPSSPLAKSGGAQLEASYVIPASSSSGRHHHHHSSLTTGDRLPIKAREEQLYPGGARSSNMRPPPPRERPGERGYDYEYTNPREEVLRDTAPRPRPRDDSFTGGRPTSMISLDRSEKPYNRMERDLGPPISTRGFDNIGRSESLRQRPRDDDLSRRDSSARGYARDDPHDGRYRQPPHSQLALRPVPKEEYVPYPEENTRHQRPRKPTIDEEPRPRPRKQILEDDRAQPRLRDPRDDKYDRDEDRPRKHHHHREGDYRKDYNERDEKDRRRDYDEKDERDRRARAEPRDRRDKAEEDGGHGGLIAGAGALAATGLAAEGARRHHRLKESRDEDGRSAKDPQAHVKERDRDLASESTSMSGEHEEEDREERRRRRRREREREERDYNEAREESRRRANENVRDPGQPMPPPVAAADPTLREQASYERRPGAPVDEFRPGPAAEEPRRPLRRRRHHSRRHHARTKDSDSYSDPSSSSLSSDDDSPEQLSRAPLRVVTPSNDVNPPAPAPPPPKGILKPPREKFPENPNNVREGVAPLDAAKKGIPPEARWTRINRKLVNPEALEAEGVRFEQFHDHVIVLKVMSQEEINHFTEKTYAIRERRRLAEGAGGGGGSE